VTAFTIDRKKIRFGHILPVMIEASVSTALTGIGWRKKFVSGLIQGAKK
jgi:hypothetical protein